MSLTLVLINRLLSILMHTILVFVIPIYIYKTTGSAKLVGITFSLEWGVRLFSLALLPSLIPKINYLKSIKFSNLYQSLVIGLLFLIYQMSDLYILLIIMGMFSSIFFDLNFYCLENFIQSNIKNLNLSSIQTKIQSVEQSSILVAPLIAGYLVANHTIDLIFFITILTFFIGYLLLSLVNIQKSEAISNANKSTDNLRSKINEIPINVKKGVSVILENSEAIELIILTNAINLIFGVVIAILPVLIIGDYGRTVSFLGSLHFIFGIVSILSIFIFNKLINNNLYNSTKFTGFLSYLVLLGIFLSMAHILTVKYLYVSLVFIASIIVIDSVFSVGLRIRRQLIFDENSFKHALPCMMFANAIAFPLSGIIVASLAEKYSSNITILATSIIALFFMMISIYCLKRLTKKRGENYGV